MKIMKFGRQGSYGQGVLEGETIHVVGGWHEGEAFDGAFSLPGHSLAELRTLMGAAVEQVPLSSVKLAVPFDPRRRIIGVGLNYGDHAAESKNEAPQHPMLFTRSLDSVVAQDEPIIRPRVSDHFDFEGKIGVVIGHPARHVPVEAAPSHVFGYCCFMDGSVRDYQKHTLTTGKNFWCSGLMGPWIVTADAIGDASLKLETRLNGEVVQTAHLQDMIFSVARLIEYCSRWTLLQPGDVIATGTPGGVGAPRATTLDEAQRHAGGRGRSAWLPAQPGGAGGLSEAAFQRRNIHDRIGPGFSRSHAQACCDGDHRDDAGRRPVEHDGDGGHVADRGAAATRRGRQPRQYLVRGALRQPSLCRERPVARPGGPRRPVRRVRRREGRGALRKRRMGCPADGASVLLDAAASFDCGLVQQVELSSHMLMIGQVKAVRIAATANPLLYMDGAWASLVRANQSDFEAYRQLVDEVADMLEQSLAAGDQPQIQLRRFVHSSAKAHAVKAGVLRDFFSREGFAPAHDLDAINLRKRQVEVSLQDVLRRRAESGAFALSDPALLGNAIIRMLNSVHHWPNADPSTVGDHLDGLVHAMTGQKSA